MSTITTVNNGDSGLTARNAINSNFANLNSDKLEATSINTLAKLNAIVSDATLVASGSIVNADINASAAIDLSKLAPVTVSRALVSDASGYVTASAVTATELGYVNGVTSAIQTQLDGKEATITGAATTITSANLTVSRALVSDGGGKVGVSSVTSTELDYLSGATSNIQGQIDALGGGAFTADAQTQITPSTAILLDEATGNEVALTLNYTVNKATSGNDTGLLINKTDTASPGTSYLIDAQVGESGSVFSVDDEANLTLGEDTDATTILGRARIHSPSTDLAVFSHFDNTTINNSAIFQTSSGGTRINSASGQVLSFRINNVQQWNIDSGGNLTAINNGHLKLSSSSAIQIAGVNTITFDASQNVFIPNGNVTLSGGYLELQNLATPTGIAGSSIIYAKDSSDGAANSTLALELEQAVEAIGTFTASHKLKIWINGTEYWVQLDAV